MLRSVVWSVAESRQPSHTEKTIRFEFGTAAARVDGDAQSGAVLRTVQRPLACAVAGRSSTVSVHSASVHRLHGVTREPIQVYRPFPAADSLPFGGIVRRG